MPVLLGGQYGPVHSYFLVGSFDLTAQLLDLLYHVCVRGDAMVGVGTRRRDAGVRLGELDTPTHLHI